MFNWMRASSRIPMSLPLRLAQHEWSGTGSAQDLTGHLPSGVSLFFFFVVTLSLRDDTDEWRAV